MIQSLRRFLLDRMVLRPTRHEIEYSPQERVLLDVSGRVLECFVQRNFQCDEPPELLILKFPGTAGRAERSTPFPMSMMPGTRVAIWTWNPPGYGSSSGRASLTGIADAGIEFYQHAVARGCAEETDIWLCGNSLGCVTALHVAATVPADERRSGIILRNPPPLLPVVSGVAERYPLGHLADRVIQSLSDSMNAMMTAPRVMLPAVFLQSELDTLVPLRHQNDLVEAYAGPRRVVLMEGLGHGDEATEEHLPRIEQSIEWLWGQRSRSKLEPCDFNQTHSTGGEHAG